MALDFPVLSWLLWSPFLGAILLLLIPKEKTALLRHFTLGVTLVGFALAIAVFVAFDPNIIEPQFIEKKVWIDSLGFSYHLGVDGINLLLVLLTAFLAPIAILSTYQGITDRVKGCMFALLFLQFGMLGAFLALDLFIFYVFWEVMLIPMLFIIGIWGGKRRIYASIKFFIYTLLGSLLMLLAILVIFFMHKSQTGVYTADLLTLYHTTLDFPMQLWLFAAFALAFAIKVPMFPFHTWLPDAHVEAPTVGSVILAAVLLKMGTYGFIRFAYPMFPEAALAFTPYIAILAVVGIIYGALVALVQEDVKKLIAYSSVSHLGFVMLGIVALDPEATAGGLMQMVNHGISTGMLFLLVGMLYERRHTRLIVDFGGIAKVMPWYATAFIIATLASIGLPGTNGFIGEFLILLGAFRSEVLSVSFSYPHVGKILVALAGIGVILGAVYMLWMVERVFFGPLVKSENKSLRDLTHREFWVLTPLVFVIFLLGVYPNLVLKKISPSVQHFIEDIYTRADIRGLAPITGEVRRGDLIITDGALQEDKNGL